MKRNEILENVLVTDAGAEGKAIARVDNRVVFINGAIPGDVIDVRVYKKKRKFLEGNIEKFHKYSEKRAEPFCEHFGVCGGCKWQNMKYEQQLFYKEKQVVDNLERIGKIEIGEKLPILASEKTKLYRNKLEYTFSNKRWLTADEINESDEIGNRNALGFHIPKKFDKILDINDCHLQAEPSNSIRLAVRDFALKNDYTFFDLREQHGFLRNLIIRTTSIGEVMLIFSFFHEKNLFLQKK